MAALVRLLVRVSPSQIGTWSDCRRKWWYSRNRPRAQNRYAEFGERAHLIAEHWLRYRTTPPDTQEGRCIMGGLEHLPMPGSVACEHGFGFEHGGVWYNGRIDFMALNPALIGDHKTTGNLRYAKTPQELANDPQWLIYATWALLVTGNSHAYGLWVYYQRTRPHHSRPVFIAEPREAVFAKFQHLHAQKSLPIVQAQGRPVDAFPRNPAACSKYGGCPYRDECWRGVDVGSMLTFEGVKP